MGGTELRKGGKEKGKGSCAEAQVLCLVAADKSAREDRNWAAVCHTTAARRGREEETWHGNCPHTPSSAVLSKIGAQGGAPFLVSRLKTTTHHHRCCSDCHTAPSRRTTDRPTAAAPQSSTARREGWEKKGGGGEKHRTERVQPFPFFPSPPFLTAASPFLHGNCSRQPFFLSFCRSLISVRKLWCLARRVLLSFFFSFLWCRYCFFFLSHDITIITISVVFFFLSRSIFFFSLLTGVYRNSALITATTTTTASSHYQDLFFFCLPFPRCVSCTIQILPRSHVVCCFFSCGVFA